MACQLLVEQDWDDPDWVVKCSEHGELGRVEHMVESAAVWELHKLEVL